MATMRLLEGFAPPLKPSFERALAVSETRVRRSGHVVKLTTPKARLVRSIVDALFDNHLLFVLWAGWCFMGGWSGGWVDNWIKSDD